ncbi:hypothetical protein AHAS_Ahas17G0144600 [Arachis hypogaea]
MGTANYGSSCSHEKQCNGYEESWSNRMSADGSNLEGVSRRRKKKFVFPMCSCETYTILFKSGTTRNSKRLFFSCSYFKNNARHYKYFAWLDEYIVSFSIKEVPKAGGADTTKKMEKRIAEIERKLVQCKNVEKDSSALSK